MLVLLFKGYVLMEGFFVSKDKKMLYTSFIHLVIGIFEIIDHEIITLAYLLFELECR